MKAVRFAQRAVVFCGLLCGAVGNAFADDAYLRLKCDGDAAGAVVMINGVAKGECPIDLALPEGTVQISVRKNVSAESFRVYEKEIFLAGGSMKRETVVLGPVQFTPEGQRIENERLAREAAEKAEAQARAAALAEQQRIEAEKAAAEAAKYGMTADYFDAISCKDGDDDNFLTWTSVLVYAPLFLPVSTLSDLASGKTKLMRAALDPAVFGNPDSMVARTTLGAMPAAAAAQP